MDKQVAEPLMEQVYFALCKSVDSPVSLGAWLRFKHNQLALAEMSIDPREYLESERFREDYLVVSFLSKWKGLNTGLDLEAEALRRFTSSEEQCRATNARILLSREQVIDPATSAALFTAKRKIAKLLGPFKWSKICSGFGWGPGATDDIRRRHAFVDLKMCKFPITITEDAIPYFTVMLQNDLHWSSLYLGTDLEIGPFSVIKDTAFQVTGHNVVETVPKNAKTHRIIAKEPRANAFLQKGVGSYFRRRLKRVGIDLDDQGNNQRAAQAAFTDNYATLDLKAASDTVATELIYELLPFEWASALDDLRSKSARLPDGSFVALEKFSSMGNGFTFELESLIFWALTSAVRDLKSNEAPVLVYGDDIICSSDIADDVVAILSFCGFEVNKEKSYITGAFYESCGKHFFLGREVTPIYQKQTFAAEVEILRCANRVMRYSKRYGRTHLDKRLYGSWCALWRRANRTRSFQIPLGSEGDDGWLLPARLFDTRPQDINLGLRCRVTRGPILSFPAEEKALLAWTLRRGVVTDMPFGGNVTSSPDTTESDYYLSSHRWVMPNGEFAQDW